MWKEIKTRRDLPLPGRYLVTREFPNGKHEVTVAELFKYKNKKHWVVDGHSIFGGNAFPYNNVIAFMDVPLPFESK